MHRKRVLIALPPDAYRRLAEMAEDEERVIDQQASLLLKRLLLENCSPIGTVPVAPAYDEGLLASEVPGRDGGLS